ncbi:MAG: VanZ family protein [Clostridia bacterium]|nr:VanZ family protein [Clostridia bacterium]
MNKKLIIRYVFWAFTLAIMVFIFVMSGQTSQESDNTSSSFINSIFTLFMDNFKGLSEIEKEAIIQSFQFIVRKLAHFSIYAALGVCSYSAIATYNLVKMKKFFLSLGFCFVYSLTDEFHQIFVEGRAGRLYDVAIDSVGALAGILFVILVLFIYKKITSRRMLYA